MTVIQSANKYKGLSVFRQSYWLRERRGALFSHVFCTVTLTLDETIALCIGLEAPPWLSKVILAHANTVLNPADPLHQMYDYVLSCMFMDSVDTVQGFLKEGGFPELELKKDE